jgi:hypothetical protein
MKAFKRIARAVVFAASVAWLAYCWIWVDEGPKFFISDWRRMALLLGICVVGGVGTLLISRLSVAVRQRLTMFAFASGTAAALFGGGYAVREFVRLYSFLAETGLVGPVAGVTCVMLFLAIGTTVSFFRYCRRLYSHAPAA